MINILLKQLAHLIGYKVTWLSPCRSIDLDLHSLTELPVQRRNHHHCSVPALECCM